MPRLTVRLLEHRETRKLRDYLALYHRCFNPDERVSARILRRVIKPSPARTNPVHLFAAYLGDSLVGGAITLELSVRRSRDAASQARSPHPARRAARGTSRSARAHLEIVRRGHVELRGVVATSDGALRLSVLSHAVAHGVLRPLRPDSRRTPLLLPAALPGAAAILAARHACLRPRALLWPGRDAPASAAAPQAVCPLGGLRRPVFRRDIQTSS
jgi:hypothetical protein